MIGFIIYCHKYIYINEGCLLKLDYFVLNYFPASGIMRCAFAELSGCIPVIYNK